MRESREKKSALAGAVFFRLEVLDRDDVQRIEHGNFTVGIEHREAMPANQHELGVRDGVFMPVRGAQGKRPEPARQASPHVFHIHEERLWASVWGVNYWKCKKNAES